MIETPFDVNDAALRNAFFTVILPKALDGIEKDTAPLWGKMNAQQMMEHLIWTFEAAVGKIILECKTPDRLLPRVKAFLHNNTETPRDFKNPLLGDNPLPLRFLNFEKAKIKLLEEANNFIENSKINPGSVYLHPIFGPLNNDEWERAMYKHCCHHLTQFGLISMHQSETIS